MNNNRGSTAGVVFPTHAPVLEASSFLAPMERRSATRFAINMSARYQALGKRSNDAGEGTTINIGSHGLLITAEHNLTVGAKLEVLVEWPALLDGAIELVLAANGKVVRVRESSFALELSRYEFRTTKRKVKSAAGSV